MAIAVPTAPWAHSAFDLLAWASATVTGWALYRWRLREAAERLAGSTGPRYYVALALGAAAGAWAAGSFNTLRSAVPTLSHSVAGALAGGIVAVELYKLAVGIRVSTGTSFVGPFTVGVVVGRLGCLFSGLADGTFGSPSGLPWAVDIGDGLGRHPVQIYESLAMLAFLAVFLTGLAKRRPWALQRAFYVMAGWYGVQRFAWEFLKPYPTLVGPLNVFHLLSVGLVVYACVYFAADAGRRRG